MSDAKRFFQEEYKQSILQNINTGAVGKVLSLNDDKSRANVQPLFLKKTKDGEKRKQTPIYGAPVARHCRNDIWVGATVFYVAAQRSLANLNGANYIDPDSHTFFSDNDAVILGVLS